MTKRPMTDPTMDQKALSMLIKARLAIPHISAVRGKAWLEIETDNVKERYRIVWAAVYPDKIRVSLLLYGSPVETIVFDGERISFLSHTGRHGFYTREVKDMNLERYIGIPVRISELILILLGTLPITGWEDIYFAEDDPSMSTIVVRDKKNARIQYIVLGEDKKIIHIKFHYRTDHLIYKFLIRKYMDFPFGEIPVQIELSDIKKRKILLDITDFEPQFHIKKQIFQLTESE